MATRETSEVKDGPGNLLPSTPVELMSVQPSDKDEGGLPSIKNVQISCPPCWLCGEVATAVAPLQQIQFFKAYILHNWNQSVGCGDERTETCARCLQEVSKVYDLAGQIDGVVGNVVERVATLRNMDVPAQEEDHSQEQFDQEMYELSPADLDIIQDIVDKTFVDVQGEIPFSQSFGELLSSEAEKVLSNEEQNLLEQTSELPSGPDQSFSSVPLQQQQPKQSDTGEKKDPPKKTEICPHCKKSYTKKGLKPHIKLVHNGHRPHECSACGKTFSQKGRLSDHMKWTHNGESKSKAKEIHTEQKPILTQGKHGCLHNCSQCEKSFATSWSLVRHVKLRHSNETFRCTLCSTKLRTQRQWVLHEATVCKVRDKWGPERLKEYNVTLLTCPEEGCGKQYDSLLKDALKKHISAHSKPVNRLIEKQDPAEQNKCPTCGKKLSCYKNLVSHINTLHLKILPYKCAHCSKAYSKAYGLAKHIKTTHAKEMFPCSLCAKKCDTPINWAIHEATVCKVAGWTDERLKKDFNVTLIRDGASLAKYLARKRDQAQ